MAKFKKIADVDVINTLNDDDNVVIIGSDGALKQTSSSNLGMDITKTEVVEAPAENDTLVVVSEGAVKQVPAASFVAGKPVRLFTDVSNQTLYSGDVTTEDGTIVTNDIGLQLAEQFANGTPIILFSGPAAAACIGAMNDGESTIFLFAGDIRFDTNSGGAPV